MNAERLLAYYERIADAPDAIGRLRRFILDLRLVSPVSYLKRHITKLFAKTISICHSKA